MIHALRRRVRLLSIAAVTVATVGLTLPWILVNQASAANASPLNATIDQAPAQTDPTNVLPVMFTVAFTKPVNPATFDVTDVDTSLSTASGVSVTSVAEIAPFDGTTFNVAVTGSGEATIRARLLAEGIAPATLHGVTGSSPWGIAIDAAGNVFTANGTSDVTKITPAGVTSTLGPTGLNPLGIAADPSGNVFTANLSDDTVTKITPGGTVTTFASTGAGPEAITVDTAGNVYTANGSASTVTKITPGGTPSNLGSTGVSPQSIAVDAAGNVYTANYDSDTVTRFAAGGGISTLGPTGAKPQAIAVDADGNVFTANRVDDTVTRISAGGAVTTNFASTGASPRSITVDAAGNVYTANYVGESVTKITPGGVATTLGSTGTTPQGIVLGPAGQVYVSNTANSRVTKLNRTGVFDLTGSPNLASTSTDDTVTIDTTPPAAPATSPDLTAATDSGASSTDDITMVTSPQFTFVCGSGNTVTLRVDGVASGTALCAGGTATITVPAPLSDGVKAITFTESDAAGNASAPSPSRAVTIDTSAPVLAVAPDLVAASDSGSSNSDDLTADTTPSVDVSCTTGDTVELLVDAVATGITTPCSGGSASLTAAAALSDGVHTLAVMATDLAGNTSAPSPGLSITVDTTAPVVAVVAPDLVAASDTGASSTDDLTSQTLPTFTMGCTTGLIVSLLIDGSGAGTTTCVGGFATITVGTALLDGVHSATFTQTDAAGNTSLASPGLAVTVDTAPPATPVAAPDLDAASDSGVSSSDNITSDTTPTIAVACTTGTAVTLLVDAAVAGSTTCAAGTALITISPALTNGGHIVTATQTDAAGNTSASSPSLAITIDTIGPAAPTFAPDLDAASDSGASSNDDLTSDTTPSITVACTPGDLVTLLVNASPSGTASCVGGTATITVSSVLSDGLRSVTFAETDLAGNVSNPSPALSITIDTAPPAAPGAAPDLDAASDSGASSTDDLTGDTTPTFTVVCTTGNVVTLYTNAIAGPTASCAGGASTITVTGALADGPTSITFTETDLAGNESLPSPGLTITIDSAAPVAPSAPDLDAASDSGMSDSDDITSNSTPTITVGCTTGDSIALSIDAAVVATTSCVAGVATFTAAPPLVDGAHTVAATATDAAGNTSTPSPTLIITVDGAPPIPATLTQPLAGTAATGTGAAGTTLTVTDSAATVLCTAVIAGGGTWSCTLGRTIAGETVTLTTVDVAGNSSVATVAIGADTDGDGTPDSTDGDDDNDGVSDADEVAAIGGDGNGDGTPDSLQANVASFPNAVSGHPSTIVVAGSVCRFESAGVVDAASLAADPGFTYPVGLFDYQLRCSIPGAAANVTVHLGGSFATGSWTTRKLLNGIYGSYTASFAAVTTGGQPDTTFAFTVTDGGPGDDDLASNNVIVDPIGPALGSGPLPTTTTTTTTTSPATTTTTTTSPATTTTAVAPTTTTTPMPGATTTTTTTTTPAAGATTSTSLPLTPATTIPVSNNQVGGVGQETGPAVAPAEAASPLAITGSNPLVLVIAGLLLMLAGAVALRRHRARQWA